MNSSRYAFSLLSTLFVLGSMAGISTNALADHFGNDGDKGFDGQAGDWGRDGQNEVINLVQDPGGYRLELNGGNGEDGRNGGDGEHASQCVQEERHGGDLYGADGGDAGKGGDGGRGGDGGNVTIYYRDLAQLRSVLIRAEGGNGGNGGISGRPGEGCECTDHSWEIRSRCDSNKDGKVEETCVDKFECHDGDDGVVKGNGVDGNPGRDGVVTLIKSNTILKDDHPTQSHRVSSVLAQDFVVNKHMWQEHSGVSELLAPGSLVAHQYREYTLTQSAAYRFQWNERRAPEEFALDAQVSLEDASNINIRFSGNAMADAQVTKDQGVNIININKVFTKAELEKFVVGKMEGRGHNTVLHITDKSNLGLVGNLSVHLTVKARNVLGLFKSKIIKDVYVSPDLVTQTAEGVEVKIGKLVEKAENEFKKEGQKFWIELTVTRSWEGQSVSKSFEDIERELK